MPVVVGAETGAAAAGISAPGVSVLDTDPSNAVAQQAPSHILSSSSADDPFTADPTQLYKRLPSSPSLGLAIALVVLVLAVRRMRQPSGVGQVPEKSQTQTQADPGHDRKTNSQDFGRIFAQQRLLQTSWTPSQISHPHHHLYDPEKSAMEDESRGVSEGHAGAGHAGADRTATQSAEGPSGTSNKVEFTFAGAPTTPATPENEAAAQKPPQPQQRPYPEWLKARPPPAPPLTPIQPSHTIFTLHHHPSSALPEPSTSPLDSSLSSGSRFDTVVEPDAPNSPSALAPSRHPSDPADEPTTATTTAAITTTATARRRSYTKTIAPSGLSPRSPTTPQAEFQHQASGSPPPLHMPGLGLSSSFPSSSPALPPPPPSAIGMDAVQGEIISVTDEAGHGWKRHTRVYGGGACLACAAAARSGLLGGFYGRTVRPEEMGREGMGVWR